MTVARLVLAGLLLLLCTLLGMRKAATLARRAEALSDFLAFVRYLEVLIRVNRQPIPEALELCAGRFAGRWTGLYAAALAGAYGRGHGARGLWGSELETVAATEPQAAALTPEDRQMIAFFGDQLGKADIKTIADNYTFLYKQIQDGITAAQGDCTTRGRLYRTVGTLAGLAAAIVIA